MDEKEKLLLLQELFDVDWGQDTQCDYAEDLVRYVRCVLSGGVTSWSADCDFIDVLLSEFDDNHNVWAYIALD